MDYLFWQMPSKDSGFSREPLPPHEPHSEPWHGRQRRPQLAAHPSYYHQFHELLHRSSPLNNLEASPVTAGAAFATRYTSPSYTHIKTPTSSTPSGISLYGTQSSISFSARRSPAESKLLSYNISVPCEHSSAPKPHGQLSLNETKVYHNQHQIAHQSSSSSLRRYGSGESVLHSPPLVQYNSPSIVFSKSSCSRPQHNSSPVRSSLGCQLQEMKVDNDTLSDNALRRKSAVQLGPSALDITRYSAGSAPSFRRVHTTIDLLPRKNLQVRSAHPDGDYIRPLHGLTTDLQSTYRLCNPAFKYESSRNPRRVLTKPSKGTKNGGYDNDNSDYVLYVNDILGGHDSHQCYLILDILGQGTFGQVVKCQDLNTAEIVAVKVIKNQPAYFNQSMTEVAVLELLNGMIDRDNEHHILRLRDKFIHHDHLCLVFELLSSNLYDLIKQNQFRGLNSNLVRRFAQQLLDALSVLKDAKLIHCDLKPENILLENSESPNIKVIDFGSACNEKQTVYTYIQSRFYRSPEVILGLPYTTAIDMWSLGCIVAELFLGLPLFPGSSEYNQICRIVDMIELPPQWMIEAGKQAAEYFEQVIGPYGKAYRLKSVEKYSQEHKVMEQPSKKYFASTHLADIITTYPMFKCNMKPDEVEREKVNRMAFIDFVQGLLNFDPRKRWTPQQAKEHPFITNERFSGPFTPPPIHEMRPQVPPLPALPALNLKQER
ncbi:kinase-like domain-containing protein [Lipomyces chichibuensis]|uniref:kinase-like domain-containing protein n=1 Tax=Lipomyces chichibuensis TaxID=1546026 RepID=UPI0033432157